MNVFLVTSLCALFGIYHIGGIASPDIDATKLANVIADAIGKAQENYKDETIHNDGESSNNDAKGKAIQNLDDEYINDDNDAAKKKGEGDPDEIPDEELIDLLQFTIKGLKERKEARDEEAEVPNDEYETHKLVRRGWFRRVARSFAVSVATKAALALLLGKKDGRTGAGKRTVLRKTNVI